VFSVNGQDTSATDGMTLSAALIVNGYRALRGNPVLGDPRGAYCGMGACYECEVVVDEITVRACLTPIRPGMRVRTELS
jgi:aerobic-type carbon monoxide dehydrogenase small subunit (CoxS/CutS family)